MICEIGHECGNLVCQFSGGAEKEYSNHAT